MASRVRSLGRATRGGAVLLLLAAALAVPAAAQPPSVRYTADLTDTGIWAVAGVGLAADGGVWLAGTTTSHNLAVTSGAADTTFLPGDFDEGYVVKFSSAGELVYASYLGGGNVDDVGGMALDAEGNVLIVGTTYSDDFPVTPGAYQPSLASPGAEDVFVVRLDPDGVLLDATYFGGNGRDIFPAGTRGNPGAAVIVAPDQSVYVAGGTGSTDLPTTFGHQAEYGGGTQDAFLAKFSNDLRFQSCTYLGGANNEGAYRVRVDPAGGVYLLGLATRLLDQAWSFPVTPGALQTNPSGDVLLFVSKFDAAGALAYATFLGPDAGDPFFGEAQGDLGVDAAGNAYVVGVTTSPDFPTSVQAYQKVLRGFSDLFVSKLDPAGSRLEYSTYFGGSLAEVANGEVGVRIATNAAGNAYVAANTDSLDLPLERAFETTPSGRFIAKLGVDGSDLEYSSYLRYRGFGVDALALAPSAAGPEPAADVYVAGPSADPRGIAVVGISESTAACTGDCGGDGAVEDEEIRLGVEIALGRSAAMDCEALDLDRDERVTVPELVGAVAAKLAACA